MTKRDLFLQEIEDTPEYILEEILNVLRHLKQRPQQTKTVRLISEAKRFLVLFEEVLGDENLKENFLQQSLSPVTKIQYELKDVLVVGGYSNPI
jgi:predicted nucleic acid-binding protein